MLANSEGLDKMLHPAAFYLGLNCLPKYPFRWFGMQRGATLSLFYS